MQRIQALIQLLLLSLGAVKAFSPTTSLTNTFLSKQQTNVVISMQDSSNNGNDAVSRREWVQSTLIAAAGLSLMTTPSPALASGGATAGGVYLLSAKQRYNARVTAGIKTFLTLETTLSAGSLDETKAFFTSEEEGSWKDSAAAGYLLANAFRRSSSTPPDSLPSVKKWKAFAGELDVLQKSLKKKDIKGVTASYGKAVDLLDAYLDAVELPPSLDLRQT